MKSLVFILLLICSGLSLRSQAQPIQDLIPTLESAESVFRTAVQAYDDQQFDVADRLFGVVANNYEFHKKTTAALLMQGKALYQNQQYQQAIEVLRNLTNRYPTSRYINEAQQIIAYADLGVNNVVVESQSFKLGIALPLNAEAAALSQQLFNGIRMAVDEYNQSIASLNDSLDRPEILMIFRDTENNVSQTRQVIRDLIDVENVDAIIGPLFSSEAIAAAEEAERSNTVMIAPLATAKEVSENRRFVFQANPTLEVRGKLMARFVVRGLGLESIGLITDYTNSESLGMARGFERELSELGVALEYQHFISDARSWFRLGDEISRDTLLLARAVYLPINGGNASTLIGGALGSLGRMGVGSRLRILGNVEWHNIANVSLASNYSATYSNDFYVASDDSIAINFQNRYISTYSESPSRLSYSGYDVTAFLTRQLNLVVFSPSLNLEAILRGAPPFQGVGIRIDFSNGNVNESMFYHRYRDGNQDLLR